MSAQDLSNAVGGVVSRGVIANIENGRKRDLTVDELILLSWALAIPPVALALPLDKPNQFISLRGGQTPTATRAFDVVNWFITGRRFYDKYRGRRANPAGAVALARLEQVQAYRDARANRDDAGAESAASKLAELGVDTRVFTIDDKVRQDWDDRSGIGETVSYLDLGAPDGESDDDAAT
jgi:hypothetical protein